MAQQDSSPAGLLQGIAADMQSLIRSEIALARSELQEILDQAKVAGPALAGGGAGMGLGGLLLVIALAEMASSMLGGRRWAGYTVVGLLFAGVGYLLLQNGRQQLEHAKLVPQQTIQTMQENVDWLKERTVGDEGV